MAKKAKKVGNCAVCGCPQSRPDGYCDGCHMIVGGVLKYSNDHSTEDLAAEIWQKLRPIMMDSRTSISRLAAAITAIRLTACRQMGIKERQ